MCIYVYVCLGFKGKVIWLNAILYSYFLSSLILFCLYWYQMCLVWLQAAATHIAQMHEFEANEPASHIAASDVWCGQTRAGYRPLKITTNIFLRPLSSLILDTFGKQVPAILSLMHYLLYIRLISEHDSVQIKLYMYVQKSQFTNYLTGLWQTVQMWHPLPLDSWTWWGKT